MRIAYKVVRRTPNGSLRSILARTGPRKKDSVCGRYYALGRIARAHPKSFGIFCFDSYSNALHFAERWHGRVYKVRAFGEPVVPAFVYHCDLPRFSLYDTHERGYSPPLGAVCYPAIRLLNQVWS